MLKIILRHIIHGLPSILVARNKICTTAMLARIRTNASLVGSLTPAPTKPSSENQHTTPRNHRVRQIAFKGRLLRRMLEGLGGKMIDTCILSLQRTQVRGSQLQRTPAPGHPAPSSGLHTYLHCTCTHTILIFFLLLGFSETGLLCVALAVQALSL